MVGRSGRRGDSVVRGGRGSQERVEVGAEVEAEAEVEVDGVDVKVKGYGGGTGARVVDADDTDGAILDARELTLLCVNCCSLSLSLSRSRSRFRSLALLFVSCCLNPFPSSLVNPLPSKCITSICGWIMTKRNMAE